MLSDLIIKNFAIIENLHVQFGAGFNVLTGETGAGKSIIIDAVNLLLGGRARGDVIRAGSDDATVEAIFDLENEPFVLALLDEQDLADGNELLVRRVVSRAGKNRIFVNGSSVSLNQLRGLTSRLVNIYGQHEHQNLQRTEAHLALLDDYAGLAHLLGEYRQAYQDCQLIQKKLTDLDIAERERQQRVDMLSFQQNEISAAKVVVDEDIELEQERSLLLHAEKLMAATAGGYETLYAGQQAVCGHLTQVVDQLETLQDVDPQLMPLVETLQNSLFSIEDAAHELHSYSEKLNFEPRRQEEVEERLALLGSLKRKYAPTLEELLDYLGKIESELKDLSDVDARREQLQRELVTARSIVNEIGHRLSEQRKIEAQKLSAAVEKELAELAMPKASFELRFLDLEEPAIDGFEQGEFFLAANPGEPPQPLAKIASGGELSRIMLALKRSAPDGDGVRTLIFDEVDAGIGGEAATAVGEKISRLGHDFQVLCVTHLPQVAAFADQHYQVSKSEISGRTSTCLQLLAGSTQVDEMARMLGGAHVGERTLEHARELIENSKGRKSA